MFKTRDCNTEQAVKLFDFAAGSVPGRRHVGSGNLLVGRNNQDFLSCRNLDGDILVSVHDGCGSHANSEFGSIFAASALSRSVARIMAELGRACVEDLQFWQAVKIDMLDRMYRLACLAVGEDEVPSFIQSHMMFTTVGALVTSQTTVVFILGDGLIALNGICQELGPFPENAPPYLAYSLLNAGLELDFTLVSFPTERMQTLALATDGVIDLVGASESPLPGKTRLVGSLASLFEQNYLFGQFGLGLCSERTLTGWMRQVNSEVSRLEGDNNKCNSKCNCNINCYCEQVRFRRYPGLLPDDTSLVLLKRREGSKHG